MDSDLGRAAAVLRAELGVGESKFCGKAAGVLLVLLLTEADRDNVGVFRGLLRRDMDLDRLGVFRGVLLREAERERCGDE